MSILRDILFPESMSRWFPSAIAVPKDAADSFLYGREATLVSSERYDLLVNWKLLLGKPSAWLQQERTENPSLARILDRYSLETLVAGYFQHLLKTIKTTANYSENPQFVIGVPAISDVNQVA